MKTKDSKVKIVISAISIGITLICTAIALIIPLKTTNMKIIGSFASIFLISIVTWKFPKRFYIIAILFHFFAASLGSVINLYRYLEFYDKIVH